MYEGSLPNGLAALGGEEQGADTANTYVVSRYKTLRSCISTTR